MRGGSHACSVLRLVQQRGECVCQGLWVGVFHQQSGAPAVDDLLHTNHLAADHRTASSHAFNQRQRHAFVVGGQHADLGLSGAVGVLSSSMHRDDFAQRGMAASAQTQLAFDVKGADILVLDDVLHTGRTVRAVLNELYDYGRPARVRLAVLVDRGGRELPVQADFAAARIVLPANQSLALARTESEAGTLYFEIREV